MADETNGAITTSPVAETQTQAEPSPATVANEDYSQATIDSMTPAQRAEWKQSGKLPEKSAASAPAVKTESAPESETGNENKEPSPGAKPQISAAEKRIKELHAEARDAKARADRFEQQLNALTAAKPKDEQPIREVKVTPPAVEQKPTRPKPTAQDMKADGVTPQFKDWEELQDALIDWKVEQREAAKAAKVEPPIDVEKIVDEKLTAAQKQAQADEQNRQWNEKWTADTAEAVKRHPDFAEKLKAVTVSEFTPEGKPVYDPDRVQFEFNGAIDVYVMHSPNCQEMIYNLANNPAEITRIQEIRNPYAAARELALLETKWFGEKPGEKKEKVTPAPKITKQSDPIKPVSGTNSAPEDEEMSAVEANDFRKFRRLADADDRKRNSG